MNRYDPLAAEIHRRSLENIVREMALTLEQTSGSPVVSYAHDFSTCLLDPQAEQLALVAYALSHSATSWIGTQTLVETLDAVGEKPRPGDGWIVNDPYDGGAAHQGDIAIIMPLFYRGEHMGWCFANVHVMDVGGVGVSGYAPGARSVYEEGLRLPIVRAIHDGELDRAWERSIAANVRVPDLVINDLRSMIAANHVAQGRFGELVDRVGVQWHWQYSEINKKLTEDLLRSRIERIPDGIYESRDWVEYDGGDQDLLLDVGCTLEVVGSELRFSFSGAAQIDAYVNCCKGGVYGKVMVSLLTTLGYGDLPFNAGMWRPITIDVGPQGTIVNPVPPAPVSAGQAETGSRIGKLVKHVLSQALSLSDDPILRGRLGGQPQDGPPTAGLFGVSQHGTPTVVWYLDSTAGQGGGAQTVADGQDCYGGSTTAGVGLTDIEVHEAADPVVFLWRKLLPNSGGPGQFRGGQGMDQAYTILYTDRLAGYVQTACAEVPPIGFGGGYPASASSFVPTFSSDVDGIHPLEGHLAVEPAVVRNNEGYLVFRRGDINRFYSGGGGGVGDPLLRDPAIVSKDVHDGYVTPQHAAAAYGVVTDALGKVDKSATAELREQILRERIGRKPSKRLRAPASVGVSIALARDGMNVRWLCGYCNTSIGQGDWHRSRSVVRRSTRLQVRYEQLGMRVRNRREAPELLFVEFFCAACAGCLEVRIISKENGLHPVAPILK